MDSVPTYDDLLVLWKVEDATMKEKFTNHDHLIDLASNLDRWEMVAILLRIPNSEIESIKILRDIGVQRIRMLECWKQRNGSAATYEALTKALLKIGRTDLAEKVIVSARDARILENTSNTQPEAKSQVSLPNSLPSESEIETAASNLLLSTVNTSQAFEEQIVQNPSELEEEFFKLVQFVEVTLKNSETRLETVTRRFSMLPQSIRRRHQTDENYRETRYKILNSTTIKELFDNLTELKHWNYMIPDTLAHILQDIKIDDIHRKIETYKKKLTAFKASTKLRDLIGLKISVPDYCIELTLEVKGWEDKTIEDAERAAVNILQPAGYCSQTIGWKKVITGSLKLTFILTQSISLDAHLKEKVLAASKDYGVMDIKIDGEAMLTEATSAGSSDTSVMRSRLWYRTGTTDYGAGGGRDVLIIAPDLSLPHPEAVARRPGQLTEEDKLELQSQGLPLDCQDELATLQARYDLDKQYRIVGIKLGQSQLCEEILKSIGVLLKKTQNNGVILHYIGAGRRGTGDWCFEDGFITFRDIAQLYLRASHNFKGYVLTIVSDCSYSGCWVGECAQLLDEQGVQPCGHKAREKGTLINVYTSCKSNEIPTAYRYSVGGTFNDKNTGDMVFLPHKQLLDSQKTSIIDSTTIRCDTMNINEPCTIQPDFTWEKWMEGDRLFLVYGVYHDGRPCWSYVLLENDEQIIQKFHEKVESGHINAADYGQILHSGWGEGPPSQLRESINRKYKT